jgi:hypothetical protein
MPIRRKWYESAVLRKSGIVAAEFITFLFAKGVEQSQAEMVTLLIFLEVLSYLVTRPINLFVGDLLLSDEKFQSGTQSARISISTFISRPQPLLDSKQGMSKDA